MAKRKVNKVQRKSKKPDKFARAMDEFYSSFPQMALDFMKQKVVEITDNNKIPDGFVDNKTDEKGENVDTKFLIQNFNRRIY